MDAATADGAGRMQKITIPLPESVLDAAHNKRGSGRRSRPLAAVLRDAVVAGLPLIAAPEERLVLAAPRVRG